MEFLKQAWHWFLGVPYLKDVVINLVAGFIGWLIGKYWGWILRLHHRFKLKRLNKRTAKKYLESIIPFDTVSPCYEEGKAKMRLTNKRFVFEIPEDKRKELESQTNLDGTPKFSIHEPAKLDNNKALYDFLMKHYHTAFPNELAVDNFLEKQISDTAQYFIDRLKQGKLAFNNKQIGVDKFIVDRKDNIQGGGAEKPTLDMYLYETDYFTAQVMVHIYQYLRQLDTQYEKTDKQYVSPFNQIKPDNQLLNNEMKHFMSSVGVGGYLVFDKGNGLEYLTVTRSDSVRNGSDKNIELRSYSFDETMDLRDCTENIKGNVTIDVYEGANRALQEELGLFKKEDNKVKGHVSDFHLTGLILIRTKDEDPAKSRFEMQLLGYTYLYFDENFTYDDFFEKKMKAQDAAFEAVNIFCNPIGKKLVGTVRKKYTHTPESVYYADILRNIEDMEELSQYYLR